MADNSGIHGLSEFNEVGPNDPLRQGDVVVETSRSDQGDAYIVVTADCDLTHNKYGGKLTALPVVSLNRYLRDFWIDRELRTQREQLATRVRDEMRRLIGLSSRNLPEPSPDRLLAWPLTASPAELAATLQLSQENLKEVSDLACAIQLIDQSEGRSLETKWRTCCEAMFSNNIKTQERARATLVKRVSRELPRQLPGDVLFLNRPFPATTEGFIALVRFPVQIDPDMIARTPADLVYAEAVYRRVGRLVSPYRYRLTQLFAEVYSAIGLSDEYEAARSERFEQAAERINNEVWK